MFNYHIIQHVPDFILRDKNGYALARAIEAALKYMNEHVAAALGCVLDVDSMPEWRLDEMAWELNCLYDFNGSLQQKRNWIREALPMYRIWGTKESIRKYLEGYFENVEVEENWFYNGDPYHFRIFVEGEWNPQNEAWTINAVDKAKNVRSVLDDIAIGCMSYLGLTGEGKVLAKFPYPFANTAKSGELPQENYKGIIDNSNKLGLRDDTISQKFPYEQSGTSPDVNVIGIMDEGGRAAVSGGVTEKAFDYNMANESDRSGTEPQISTVGVLSNNNIQSALADDIYMMIHYRMCGQDEF